MSHPLELAIGTLHTAIVEAIQNSEETENLADMATVLVNFYTLKTLHSQLDEVRKKLYHRVDLLDKTIIPKMMEDQGVDKVAVPEIARSFYKLQKFSASMKDKPAGFEWLTENDLGEMITQTVNAGTLAKALKEWILETGKEPPETIFKFTEYTTIGSSKYTPK